MLLRSEFLISLFILFLITNLSAQIENPWSVEGGITISHFQQQVKTNVGGPKGDELINNFEFGFLAAGTYQLMQYLSVGLFSRFDTGKRSMALFDGFDEDGKTTVTNQLGGTYTEFWFGPLLRGKWKMISLEVGFAPFGIRSDGARTDVQSESGNSSESFRIKPGIAWLIALGGNFSISENLCIVLKIEYRVRYYDKRGGENLANDVNLGSQSIAPILGVVWNF